ncbi:hypothetical protein L484_010645 [Morus notabilis]|uniref:Uncharacterized protein n=1 Tax=Morus notabilis TaxID=981085 RepID=W9RPQ2_9ROSA|nr:hypothetical protein L484_010645 [Morus notabilis]
MDLLWELSLQSRAIFNYTPLDSNTNITGFLISAYEALYDLGLATPSSGALRIPIVQLTIVVVPRSSIVI